MLDFIDNNAFILLVCVTALLVLLVVLGILLIVKRGNKWREKEFELNRDTEMLRVRIGELEKEAAELHDHEAQMLSERDSILMSAHEKADDILEQTMERVQKSEAQIRQNKIVASCCITDARRRISDLMIEVSKRLVIEDGSLLDAEAITPEAVEAAEREERVAAQEYAALTDEEHDDAAADEAVGTEEVGETAEAEPENAETEQN